LAVETEDRAALIDSLILCKFLRGVFADLYAESAELLRHVTGWDVDGVALRRAGERVNTLKKLFNVREGWRREDDTLPPRILDEPLAAGPGAGETLTRADLDLMIRAYYAARSWTKDGQIPASRLRDLEIEDLQPAAPAHAA
jgi:aldehyde:ferredoxin oxidoreductase